MNNVSPTKSKNNGRSPAKKKKGVKSKSSPVKKEKVRFVIVSSHSLSVLIGKHRQPRLVAAIIRPPSFEALSTFEKARALLHVGATPDYLPCREEERDDIRSRLADAIDGQTGTCLCRLEF